MQRITLRTFVTIMIGATSFVAAQDKGKLLIIGGGMTPSMAPIIYGLLADQLQPHGTLGYLPTAGEKVEGDAVTNNRIAQNLKGRSFTLVNIVNAADADNPALVKQIESCDGIFFGGGAQSRVVAAFHPEGKDTLASKAVDALLDRGGTVAGTSAGAEIMTDPMKLMGDSEKSLADPTSLPIGRGMGYFKFGMVDQHFLQRGRFGRLVVALERTKQKFGFGISEARAMLVDRELAKLTAIGNDAVVFIDRSKAEGRNNIRVSVLGNGDVVDGHTGQVTVPATRAVRDLGPRAGAEADLTDAWQKLALEKLFHALVDGKHATASALDPHATFRFSIDNATKVYFNAGDAKDVSIVNLRLDVLQR